MGQKLYEARIINPLLKLIGDNIDYLTSKENLPQLAKLGFIYNTLWYNGRVCFGYEYDDNHKPLIKALDQCEDNPKYKLEICNVGTEEQFDLIYDAWGLHVENQLTYMKYEEFKNLILNGKTYSEVELLQQKENKTMDDWVNLFTHKDYRYKSLFPDKKSVHNYLLCTYGTGYSYRNGYIIETAGGADQDSSVYSGWENSKISRDFLKVINKILHDKDVIDVMDVTYEYGENKRKEKEIQKAKDREEKFELLYKCVREAILADKIKCERFMRGGTSEYGSSQPILDYEELNEFAKNRVNNFLNDNCDLIDGNEIEIEKYKQYYPITDKYSIITKLDKDSHPSYLKAAVEICEDIYNNTWDKKNKEWKENLKFMNQNITRLKELSEGRPWGVDKDFCKNLIKYLNK